VRLFEIGRRYLEDAERPTLGLLLAGEKAPRDWRLGKARPFDAFDSKAAVLALLEAAAAPVANLQLAMVAGDIWHPGRSATVGLGKAIVAAFGELHPRLRKELDLPEGTVAGEIYLDSIPAGRTSGRAHPAFAPSPMMPLTRDFAFIVPADLPAEKLVRAIRASEKELIDDVRVFDRYEGEQGLSLAIEVTIQPPEHALTDSEIAYVSTQVIAAAEKLGAKLRN
jgi:phenylalanyl-tRNA synthetase beta chain